MSIRIRPHLCAVLALALAGTAVAAADGPTPFPDPKDEAAWPGAGPIRVFGWMVDNRAYFWTQRQQAQGAVVFVGDSLTGNWDAKLMAAGFPELRIANRGIGGDTSRGLRFRFAEDALDLHPRALVMCIGTNDLSAHGAPADAAANIAAMIATARQQDAAMPIVLCTVPPRDNPKAPTRPGAHADLNARIVRLGADQPHLAVLDLVPVLGGALDTPTPEDFTADRLHLAAPGYRKWAAALLPVLAGLGVE